MIKKTVMILLAVVGLILSVKLTAIYFEVNFNPNALPSFCSVDNFVDCDGVAKTVYAQFLGVPNAILGLILYTFLLFLCVVEYLAKVKFLGFLKVFKNPSAYIFCVSLLAFCISMGLAMISLFEIEKICVLCFVTYAVDLALLFVSKSWGNGVLHELKISLEDFKEAIKVKRYAISFILLMTLVISFFSYTNASYAFVPQLRKEPNLNKNMTKNPYKVEGNVLGDPKAKIVVNVYSDFMCPFCYNVNVIAHRLASELDGVVVRHHNLPLDNTCNTFLPMQIHEGACLMSKYALAAKEQGKYWGMSSLMYENLPENEDMILKLAKKIKLDAKQLQEDAHSERINAILQAQIEQAFNMRITGTPTVVVNMRQYQGVIPYDEMKAELMKLGATEKKK